MISFKKINKTYKMKEKDIYKAIRKAWRGYLKRIEPKYQGGIPDILIVNKQLIPFFLELKQAESTKEGLVKIEIRLSQILWFMEYPAKAFLLAYMNGQYYVFNKEKVPLLKDALTVKQFQDLANLVTNQMNKVVKYLAINSF